jgi:hypothetical protein
MFAYYRQHFSELLHSVPLNRIRLEWMTACMYDASWIIPWTGPGLQLGSDATIFAAQGDLTVMMTTRSPTNVSQERQLLEVSEYSGKCELAIPKWNARMRALYKWTS